MREFPTVRKTLNVQKRSIQLPVFPRRTIQLPLKINDIMYSGVFFFLFFSGGRGGRGVKGLLAVVRLIESIPKSDFTSN